MARECPDRLGCYGCGNPGVRWRDCRHCRWRQRENRESGGWRRESGGRDDRGEESWRNVPRETVANRDITQTGEGRSNAHGNQMSGGGGNRPDNESEVEQRRQRPSSSAGN